MDTTLMAFHLQTSSYTQSINLIGSWDNFTKRYPMERDIRRSRSQWRGCYKFEDIICDGDGGAGLRRTGGLKMGSTYYYYYELDDGTEIHDASLPHTATCPYLPGQPVNLLSVPIEVQPSRLRSASLNSMAIEDRKTLNPADKFMAPRAPPPPPTLPRLRTAPTQLLKKRSARSVSPAHSPWSPRSFFSRRSASPPRESYRRGRSDSIKLNDSSPARDHQQGRTSGTHSRNPSPATRKVASREPSPLRQLTAQEPLHINTNFTIPEKIAEDDEDDDNFSSGSTRFSVLEKAILTPLAPPPISSRFPITTARDTDLEKPLPELPEYLGLELTPAPLRLRDPQEGSRLDPEVNFPTSHFSISTIGSSPTDSHFGFDSSDSVGDDGDLSADIGSGDESAYSPINDLHENAIGRFTAYKLPDSDYTSTQTLKYQIGQTDILSPALLSPANRATFGGAAPFSPSRDVHEENLNSLQDFMHEMGYLGGIIEGK
ncbi:hypothetical protein BJ878DRAFT_37137 [Calycina marina]|uniref:Uncharacterized protein n=1 Tax=Calycina marina TaxID=1763456 RepID=A0A9P7Z496_9HELO|nr:hypothetical protein BJ878DRAFT_37137 [Calycina marina]